MTVLDPGKPNSGKPANAQTEDAQVEVTVELFGTARIACEKHDVALRLPSSSTVADVAQALAEACPELVGMAILEDMSGLMKSYTLNLNGTAFLSGLADQRLRLRNGDTLLLFSSQAGG
ncbi:MAG: MoaD/ThiS family protein [Chloroflexi bacterium]|nr:MoaD/ThiS family protein [Chloroflexota bacterium]